MKFSFILQRLGGYSNKFPNVPQPSRQGYRALPEDLTTEVQSPGSALYPCRVRCALPLILALSATLSLSCFYDVYDGDGAALEEAQSVWQYLSVYSIYQHRVPAAAGNLTPYQMFDIISDTLKGGRYTEYMDDRPGGGGIPPGETIERAVKLSENTVYLYIPDFLGKSLESFNSYTYYMSGFYNVIIDLRYNGGGYVNVAHNMVSEFLPPSTEYIHYRRRAYNEETRLGYTIEENVRTINKPNPLLLNKNIVVLMNRWSASASEIMAAALKDKAGAHLIGDTSYGKGIGQVVVSRSNRKTLSVTHMEIQGLTARTGNYNKTGLNPDGVPEEIFRSADAAAAKWADFAGIGDSAYIAMWLAYFFGDVDAVLAAWDEMLRGMGDCVEQLRMAHGGYNSVALEILLEVTGSEVLDMMTDGGLPNVPLFHTELRELYCAMGVVDPKYVPPEPEAVTLDKSANRHARPAASGRRISQALKQVVTGNYKPIGAIEFVDELPGE